jgi:hypothetical protein
LHYGSGSRSAVERLRDGDVQRLAEFADQQIVRLRNVRHGSDGTCAYVAVQRRRAPLLVRDAVILPKETEELPALHRAKV